MISSLMLAPLSSLLVLLFFVLITIRSRNHFVLFLISSLLLIAMFSLFTAMAHPQACWVYEAVLSMAGFEFSPGFLVDALTAVFVILIGVITSAILVFAAQYLEVELDLVRFSLYIGLFALAMILFVSSDNLLQAFAGWEGVGVMSFLLVNYWLPRLRANRAALKAVFYNRIGDLGFFVALIVFVSSSFQFDLSILNHPTLGAFDFTLLTLLLIGISLATFAKSAQYGFHSWLLEAMEGPTPVSALLHSATMVTAGVFLHLRLSALFVTRVWFLKLLVFIGLLTSCFGSFAALVKRDVKKLTAFSSVSQLGLLMVGAASLNLVSSFTHLETHALFKSLLFIIMGLILMQVSLHDQDSRAISALGRNNLFITAVSSASVLALMGLPFFAGFFSKELVLQGLIWNDHLFVSFLFFTLGASVLTFFYSSFFLLSQFVAPRNNQMGARALTVSTPISFSVTLFVVFLGVGSVTAGYVLEEFIHVLSDGFSAQVLTVDTFIEKPRVVSILFSLIILFAFILYVHFHAFNLRFKSHWHQAIEFLAGNEFYVLIWKRLFAFTLNQSSYVLFAKSVDRGVFERFGPLGVVSLLLPLRTLSGWFQNGHPRYYMLYLVPFIILGFAFATLFSFWG